MGIAIKVPNVNWSANNIGKVTFLNADGSIDVNQTVRAAYDTYIETTGRTANNNLLFFINELYAAGLWSKCSGLFYLASADNNVEHVKYSLIDGRAMTVSGAPVISASGVNGNNSGRFTDAGAYNLSAGLAVVLLVSVAPTAAGIDWGGEPAANVVTGFSSYGDGNYFGGTKLRWNGGASGATVASSEDADKTGVFLFYGKGTTLRYLHGGINLTKTVAESTATINPSLLDYNPALSASKATIKLYATFNTQMSEAELTELYQIVKDFEGLL